MLSLDTAYDDDAEVIDGYRRIDNITDHALTTFRAAYGDRITKDDIFFYVYGLLHSPTTARPTPPTSEDAPRIPLVTDPWPTSRPVADSPSCTSATNRSMSIPLWDWTIRRRPATRHTTTSASKDDLRQGPRPRDQELVADRSTVVYNSRITLSGIPEEAYRYQLGSRSAVEWIIDRYQVKVDGGPKAPGSSTAPTTGPARSATRATSSTCSPASSRSASDAEDRRRTPATRYPIGDNRAPHGSSGRSVRRARRLGLGDGGTLAADGWKSRIFHRSRLGQRSKRSSPRRSAPTLPAKVAGYTGQMWALRHRIQPGDLLVLPMKTTRRSRLGRVTGGYQYLSDQEDPNCRHVVAVDWQNRVPRAVVKQDLLYTLGSAISIFSPSRNNAVARLEHLLVHGEDPGALGAGTTPSTPTQHPGTSSTTRSPSRTWPRSRPTRSPLGSGRSSPVMVSPTWWPRLPGRGLPEVDEAPPGADGGIDITAGRGLLGLESPKVIVQVKTGQIGSEVVAQLNGLVSTHGADYGLLATWTGLEQAGEGRGEAPEVPRESLGLDGRH